MYNQMFALVVSRAKTFIRCVLMNIKLSRYFKTAFDTTNTKFMIFMYAHNLFSVFTYSWSVASISSGCSWYPFSLFALGWLRSLGFRSMLLQLESSLLICPWFISSLLQVACDRNHMQREKKKRMRHPVPVVKPTIFRLWSRCCNQIAQVQFRRYVAPHQFSPRQCSSEQAQESES